MAVQEFVIYIHGVTDDQEGGHEQQYRSLHAGIRSHQPDWPATFKGVEWGGHPSDDPDPVSHQLLADAEHELGGRALQGVSTTPDFTLNPLRIAINALRPLLIYNFSDMFYYVSAQGKAAVRLAAARQIVDHLEQALEQPEPLISLTLLGHSAGSVVAFDLLFYLFYVKHSPAEFIDLKQIEPPAAERVAAPRGAAPVNKTMNALRRLRDLAQRDRLRIRRLFTFGSPITSVALRSDAVLRILAGRAGSNTRLDTAFHGLKRNPTAFGEPLKDPRWINIWDKDDPISWPVEPLMTDAKTVVVDEYIDISDNPLGAHGRYWESDEVHRLIGKNW